MAQREQAERCLFATEGFPTQLDGEQNARSLSRAAEREFVCSAFEETRREAQRGESLSRTDPYQPKRPRLDHLGVHRRSLL